jgi:hypothetical protein
MAKTVHGKIFEKIMFSIINGTQLPPLGFLDFFIEIDIK